MRDRIINPAIGHLCCTCTATGALEYVDYKRLPYDARLADGGAYNGKPVKAAGGAISMPSRKLQKLLRIKEVSYDPMRG